MKIINVLSLCRKFALRCVFFYFELIIYIFICIKYVISPFLLCFLFPNRSRLDWILSEFSKIV